MCELFLCHIHETGTKSIKIITSKEGEKCSFKSFLTCIRSNSSSYDGASNSKLLYIIPQLFLVGYKRRKGREEIYFFLKKEGYFKGKKSMKNISQRLASKSSL